MEIVVEEAMEEGVAYHRSATTAVNKDMCKGSTQNLELYVDTVIA